LTLRTSWTCCSWRWSWPSYMLGVSTSNFSWFGHKTTLWHSGEGSGKESTSPTIPVISFL
jgi:hypothetical protein